MNSLWSFISNEQFWLANNMSWHDFARLKQEESINLPVITDLLYVYPLGSVLYLIRIFFERYIAKPIGRSLGIRDIYTKKWTKDRKTTPYTSTAANNDSGPSSSVAPYIRVSPLTKFAESFWRFVYHLSMFIYGVIILRDKPWTWDTRYCWLNYPIQPLSTDIFWYYMIELAFYWSVLFSQFLDVKRKDFWQMFFHHICTIMLLSFSYIINYVRVGSLVLVIHSCADYWLQCAKMAKYVGAKRFGDTAFAIFAIVWFVTRLCYYPYKILYTTVFEITNTFAQPPSFYFFNGLLLFLHILHYFWFYLICKVVINAFKTGKVCFHRNLRR